MTQSGKDIEMREIMMYSGSSKYPNPRGGEETECREQDLKCRQESILLYTVAEAA